MQWIAYVIFGVFILLIIGFVVFIKTRPQEFVKEDVFADGSKLLKIRGEFLDKNELYYFDFIQRHILNTNFIIVPKVGLDILLTSFGNKKQYDAITSKYVDFVIFNRGTMLPIVAVDLYDKSKSTMRASLDSDVSNALKEVGVTIYVQQIEDFYTFDDLWDKMSKQVPELSLPKRKASEEEQKAQDNDKQDSGDVGGGENVDNKTADEK